MSELEPLDDDILALVQGAKELPDLDPARKAEIFAATSAKIGSGGGGGGDGGGGSGGAATGAGAGALGKIGVAIALFVAGVGVGVVIDRAMLVDGGNAAIAPAVVVVAPAPSAAATNAAEPSLAAVSATSLPDAPRAAATASVARSGGSAEAPSSRGLAAERALLDVARSALARGEAGEAIAATERHAREYPDGSLVEEREAIAVKALVALGRMGEARRRAHALEQRFPNGLTVRAVRAAVGDAP
jgi:hypothetical protein